MPRIPRCDAPGVWRHVMNRGIARRPIFETARDARFFEAQLARQVRLGLIEVHAFCVMTTHFHVLARSPCGRISDAMQSIQNRYARWFNRSRLRDGPVFVGRFRGPIVRSLAHRSAVAAYIDRNAVDARIVAAPTAYPHASAARHCRPRGPLWLDRSVVDGIVAERGGAIGAGPAAYDRAILGRSPESLAEFVERRLQDPPLDGDDDPRDDPLDDLVRAAPPRVQAWMQHKAGLADATAAGVAILSATTVLRLIPGFCAIATSLKVRLTERPRPVGDLLRAGLLRTICGLRHCEIASRVGCATSSVERRVAAHVRAMGGDPRYAALAAEIVTAGLAADFPAPLRELDLPRIVPAFVAST